MPATPVGPAAIPAHPLDVRVRNHRGRLFVGRGQHSFELSDSAAFLWRQMDGRATLHEIGQRVADEYGVPVEEAVGDAADLVQMLAEHGLVTLSEDG